MQGTHAAQSGRRLGSQTGEIAYSGRIRSRTARIGVRLLLRWEILGCLLRTTTTGSSADWLLTRSQNFDADDFSRIAGHVQENILA